MSYKVGIWWIQVFQTKDMSELMRKGIICMVSVQRRKSSVYINTHYSVANKMIIRIFDRNTGIYFS